MKAARRIIFLYWDSCFCCTDMLTAMADRRDKRSNLEVSILDIQDPDTMNPEELSGLLEKRIREFRADVVFSFGYFPLISGVCESLSKVLYVSWIFDNPVINLYDGTVGNNCNRIFLFDSEMAEELQARGMANAFYLPMAVNQKRLDALRPDDEKRRKYGAPVSFVGALYTEKHCFYDTMIQKLDLYTKGFLEGLLAVQEQLDGVSILESCLTEDIVKRMREVYPLSVEAGITVGDAWIYAEYVLARKLTSLERSGIMTRLGKRLKCRLYTGDSGFRAEGVENCGEIDYFSEMPMVFKCSDINLNISLRSIHKGIPLRIYDIMGCKGFLLTNYQEDLLQFFVPGEDFIYWESKEEIPELAEYYLTHEDERKRIAEHAYKKVCADHSFDKRLEDILKKL